ncbi:MAG TPA: hypothetical protein VHY08_08725 [Bacillota bacterium]|nr:hypothetical protein [Bacillota bacterium]
MGQRLALLTPKVAYGACDVVSSGPIYQSMTIKGNKIRLTFTDIGGGLAPKGGGELKHFAIAGADHKLSGCRPGSRGSKWWWGTIKSLTR